MSYIPPHKRVSKAQDAPPPTPARMIPQFKRSFDLKYSSRHGTDRQIQHKRSTLNKMSIIYAKNSISRWLAVPSMDDVQLPSSLCLVPVCLESTRLKMGDKQFTLVNGQGQHDIKSCDSERMWAPLVETVLADLLSAVENLRNELVGQNLKDSKPKLVARFGKVLFSRNPSLNQHIVVRNSVSESYMKNLRKMLYADLPMNYAEHIKNVVVPELVVQSEKMKELYRVKLADAKRPELFIFCDCRVKIDEKKIELYKIEFTPIRHLIEDISCLESNVDLRLALCTKNLVALQDEEVQRIRDIISTAIFDPNLKGGLKWPVGETNSGGQFSIVEVVRFKTQAYRNSCIKLRVREAERLDSRGQTGEVRREINLALTELTKNLLEERCDAGSIMTMLDDALKLIRNYFLAWDGSLACLLQ